ncbi:flagellar filament capping protein FliD [Enterovibrio sp. ZSDZ35]|uniref:Flagellar hook-associated protein 2 n=1 Tax=Enterovibrio qingdaonensis TaxID=2899818 RepID=A0ABT5QQM4_9GAMM|nr:flagellar filament capping protein FliD [Enterovibrio sp. ZSDZ35]MDD1783277.1 flagellar filament capping protein FliD [Enterovibrio sp. ZSDZ35]
MGLSATGLGSGMDITSMVNKIVEAERAPKQERIVKNMNDVETNISAYGRLKTSLNTMKDLMYDFRRDNTFAARSTVSSNEETVSASATHLAATGVYSIDVQQLAQSHKLVSEGLDADEDFGAGQLTLNLGGRSATIDIEQDKSSLLDIVRTINAHPSNPGIQASVINDDSGARLIFSGDKTGEKNQISIGVAALPGSPLEALAYDPVSPTNNMNEMQVAKDARILIDGLASVSSDSNSFSDAIRGVDISVSKLTTVESGPVTVKVDEDRATVKAAMEEFVDAYNAFYQVTKALSKYDPDTQQGGPLIGDTVIRSAVSQMRTLFTTPIEGASDSLKTLSELGIATTMEGRLEINHSMMDRQLKQNFSALEGFFGGNQGFARKIEEVVQNFTGAGGAIRNRESSLGEQRTRLQDEQEKLDRRMEDLENRTLKQFSAMDNAMAEMQGQLSAMMNIMPA